MNFFEIFLWQFYGQSFIKTAFEYERAKRARKHFFGKVFQSIKLSGIKQKTEQNPNIIFYSERAK